MIPIPSKTRNQFWYTDEERKTVAMLTTKNITTFFDAEDLERVQQHTWSGENRKVIERVYGKIANKCVQFPRFILAGQGTVKHRDNNTLNNRKSNLYRLSAETVCNIKTSPDSLQIEGARNVCRFQDASRKVVIMKMSNHGEVLLDFEDLEKVSNFLWIARKREPTSVVFDAMAGSMLYMHRMLCPGDRSVDHIDRNPANNCRDNLRQASQTDQNNNKNTQKNNTSGYNGVYLRKGSTELAGVWEVSWNQQKSQKGKVFRFGAGQKFQTCDEAKTAAIVFRRDRDAMNGCTNGHERVLPIPISMPV